MAQKTNSFEKFWHELIRRKVVDEITIYAKIAIVILKLVNIVVRSLQLFVLTEAYVLVAGFILTTKFQENAHSLNGKLINHHS